MTQGALPALPNPLGVVEVAYLLIVLDRSTPSAVAREVRKIAGVVEACITMGDFDVIAIAEQTETKGFPGIATAVQKIEGVSKVVTCVVVTP